MEQNRPIRILERNASYVTASFHDRANQLAVPSSILYRIDCLSSGQNVKPWTAITPASSIEIFVTAAENAIRDTAHAMERRLVTIIARYGSSDTDQLREEYLYEVAKVRGGL